MDHLIKIIPIDNKTSTMVKALDDKWFSNKEIGHVLAHLVKCGYTNIETVVLDETTIQYTCKKANQINSHTAIYDNWLNGVLKGIK